jgi:type III secretion system YscC/HrcC family outer membrane pore protein
MKKSLLPLMVFGYALLLTPAVVTAETVAPAGYVAKNEGMRAFFDALSSRLNKPVIVSKLAARKQITGDFDLTNAQQILETIATQMGLIWYHDGQAIYVYDAGEMRNAVGSLRNASLVAFTEFLRQSGLFDHRFPLRGENRSGTFYVSGPPIYVDLVMNAARLMDQQHDGLLLGRQKVGIVKLNNTFVGDRSYELRDNYIVVPGMASVVEKLLGKSKSAARDTAAPAPDAVATVTENSLLGDEENSIKILNYDDEFSEMKVVAYPDTNSLLVKGSEEQVRFMQNLAIELDVAKRHVELSLWIIDLQKKDLDQLGVNWSGSIEVGDKLGVSLNQNSSLSTLDGSRFLASVMALSQHNKANVVSRPIVLTQENVPAIFDNSRTFYVKLVGERNVGLEHVTYGTLVSVLPRFSAQGQIEMSLNIEDGNEIAPSYSGEDAAEMLPEVGRTRISTVARVPQGKSLLIGGYTRDSNSYDEAKVPLLGDIPFLGGLFRYKRDNMSNTVRVFLIQPREISDPLFRDASDLSDDISRKSGITIDELGQSVRDYVDRQEGRSP